MADAVPEPQQEDTLVKKELSSSAVEVEDAIIQSLRFQESGDNASSTLDPATPVIESHPEFLRLKKEGNDLFGADQFQEAVEKYKEAADFAANDMELAALLHNEGMTYEKLNDLENAIKAYSDAVAKRPDYGKVFLRRARVYKSLGLYEEAMDDMVEITCIDLKVQKYGDRSLSPFLVDLLTQYAEAEVEKIINARGGSIAPSKYLVEGFLRPFFKDPVSRIWRGKNPTPVDDLLAEGKADDLTGYLAAVRDLKLRKYENIIRLCTDEISNNPESEHILDARYLRGSLCLIWGNMSQTEEDFRKVIEHPSATDEVKSSAYLKLALRRVTRQPMEVNVVAEDFNKAEQLCPENSDVYFHGAMTLVDRAHISEAMEMLLHGLQVCGESAPPLMKTLYYTIKFSIEEDESKQKEAFAILQELEPSFDAPDCHEMFAQALLMAGNDFAEKLVEQMDKAIAYDPEDPIFRVKKIIMNRWAGDNTGCLEKLKAFVETEPNSFAYFHIGHAEIIQGNLEAGFQAIEKSIELSNCMHEIEVRVASKLELMYHLKINKKLTDLGLGSLQQSMEELVLKSFA